MVTAEGNGPPAMFIKLYIEHDSAYEKLWLNTESGVFANELLIAQWWAVEKLNEFNSSPEIEDKQTEHGRQT